MKPPWKYLARLVSRRRPSEPSDNANAPDEARNLVEIKFLPAPTILLSSLEANSGSEREGESKPEDNVTVRAAIDGEFDRETSNLTPDLNEAEKAKLAFKQEQANFDPPEPQSLKKTSGHLPKLRQATLKGAKKSGVGTPIGMTAAMADLSGPTTSLRADPFFEDATSLDRDIKHLKDMLAQKLRLQNGQLRQMLDRF